MNGTTANASRSTGKWKWFVVALVLAAMVGLAIYFEVPSRLRGLLQSVLDRIAELGFWGPVIFIVVYIAAAVCFVPGSILTLGGGALFGVLWGSVYVSIGATFGATAAFLVGRYLARDWVGKKIAGNPTFSAIDRAVAQEGWKIVLLTRLSPVFPFSLLNYGFGLTRVQLVHYVLASWIGMIPGTIMYVYIGSLVQAGARETTTAEWVLRGVGLVATVLVTVLLTRIAKKALAKRIDSPSK